MCFSADASLTAGCLLMPAGGYCVVAAVRKDRRYIPLAVVPLLFGVQQVCEAGVWLGLENGDTGLVEAAALGFLFFALAVWPGWIPLAAAAVEPRPGRRRLFFALAALGATLGLACYAPVAAHYEEWLTVGIAGHSVRYNFARVPTVEAVASSVWQVGYLAVVCTPLLMSREHRLRAFGLSVAVSAVIAHLAFRYAFASVWCFFAALLSVHLCYVLHRLPGSGTHGGPQPSSHLPI